MATNYSELRRLLADKSPDSQTANCRLANAAVDALPGLLDENERLVSNLALANRCNDELNQSATEYARKYYELSRARDSLFDAIAHGDADHRAWLKKAIDEHFAQGKEPAKS